MKKRLLLSLLLVLVAAPATAADAGMWLRIAAYLRATGGGGSVTGPSAPADPLVINQGSPTVDAAPLSNWQSITWQPATAGTYPVSSYKVYRSVNGGSATLYDTVSAQQTWSGYISGTTLTITSAPSPMLSNTVLACIANCAGFVSGSVVGSQLGGTSGSTGTYEISASQTVANSGSPATFASWKYDDAVATDSNLIHGNGVPLSPSSNVNIPSNEYAYSVSAVDSHGNESTQTAASAYMFRGVVMAYGSGCTQLSPCDDFNFGGPGGGDTVTTTYNDTSGSPANGPYDMKTVWVFGGGMQPYTSPAISPGDSGLNNDFEIGGFKYFVFDLKYTDAGQYTAPAGPMLTSVVTMLPPGDVFPWAKPNIDAYSTTPGCPTTGVWCHYKIPFSDVNVGSRSFTGSIGSCSGTAPDATCTLTVSAVSGSGPEIDAGGYITGAGVPIGTYIKTYGQAASIGTFGIYGPNLSSSTSVSSETMAFQRTAYYKAFWAYQVDSGPWTLYMNNLGFTSN